MERLAPYRARIDALDEQIIDLLRQRYSVVEAVARIKASEGIASVLPARIDEVRENAATRAVELGLDGEFIHELYTRLIEHSCRVEDRIIIDELTREASVPGS